MEDREKSAVHVDDVSFDIEEQAERDLGDDKEMDKDDDRNADNSHDLTVSTVSVEAADVNDNDVHWRC